MEALKTANGLLYNATVMPALCLDLDGTVRYSRSGGDFISYPGDIALFDGIEDRILEYRNKDWLILGISNQGGVAYGHKTFQDIDAELDAMIALVLTYLTHTEHERESPAEDSRADSFTLLLLLHCAS